MYSRVTRAMSSTGADCRWHCLSPEKIALKCNVLRSQNFWRSSEKWEAEKKPFGSWKWSLQRAWCGHFSLFIHLSHNTRQVLALPVSVIFHFCFLQLILGSASRVMFTAKCFPSKYCPVPWDISRYTTQLALGFRVLLRILPIWKLTETAVI